jgi:hypothetical protein
MHRGNTRIGPCVFPQACQKKERLGFVRVDMFLYEGSFGFSTVEGASYYMVKMACICPIKGISTRAMSHMGLCGTQCF